MKPLLCITSACYSRCLASTHLLVDDCPTCEVGVAHVVTALRFFTSATCGGGSVREVRGGGNTDGDFVRTPAPNDKLLLKPDSLVFTGEEGAEFGAHGMVIA